MVFLFQIFAFCCAASSLCLIIWMPFSLINNPFLLVVAKFLFIKDLTVVDGAMPYFEPINKPSLIFFMGVGVSLSIFKARYSPSVIL